METIVYGYAVLYHNHIDPILGSKVEVDGFSE